MRLLPRDGRFFDLFTEVASLNLESAKHLRELFTGGEDVRVYRTDAIKRLERQADGITHEIVTRLDKTFITPLDREDIHMLASRLHDVLDRIDGIARRTQIFRTETPPQGVVLLCDVAMTPIGPRIFWQGGVNVVQHLEKLSAPNAVSGAVVFTNLPPTATASDFTDVWPIAPFAFYRVRAYRLQ